MTTRRSRKVTRKLANVTATKNSKLLVTMWKIFTSRTVLGVFAWKWLCTRWAATLSIGTIGSVL